MRDTWPLLDRIHFPPIRRGRLDTLQVNVGYRCNQSCLHCHVAAGPNRTEEMSGEIADLVISFLERQKVSTLDITGGAPELNPHFRRMVTAARDLGLRVMDRCNLTIFEVEGHDDLPQFLADQQVEIVASMPCYLEDNVERQRGKGVFDASIRGLQKLNALGYGDETSGLVLNLVYNPQGPSLPPPQAGLEADYKRVLGDSHGIRFNSLYTLANMPIQRFGSMLISKGLVRRLSRAFAKRASRRQSGRRHVPQPDLGGLSRLTSMIAISTRCSIFRSATAATKKSISRPCSTAT